MAERVKQPFGGEDQRCPECKAGYLVFRSSQKSKYEFIGCSAFPTCRYTTAFVECPMEQRARHRIVGPAYRDSGWDGDDELVNIGGFFGAYYGT